MIFQAYTQCISKRSPKSLSTKKKTVSSLPLFSIVWGTQAASAQSSSQISVDGSRGAISYCQPAIPAGPLAPVHMPNSSGHTTGDECQSIATPSQQRPLLPEYPGWVLVFSLFLFLYLIMEGSRRVPLLLSITVRYLQLRPLPLACSSFIFVNFGQLATITSISASPWNWKWEILQVPQLLVHSHRAASSFHNPSLFHPVTLCAVMQ